MVICEGLLFLVAAVSLFCSMLTDIRTGKVKNLLIIIAGALGIIISVLYLILFAREYIYAYLLNILLTVALSYILFIVGLWGAGDSKLLILMSVCMPGRLFYKDGLTSFPGFILLAIIFACSFIILLVETLIKSIKQRRKLQLQLSDKATLSVQIKRTVSSLFIIGVVNGILVLLQSKQMRISQSLVFAMDFVVILILNNQRKQPSKAFITIGGCAFIGITIANGMNFSWSILLVSFLAIILIYSVQALAGQDNYSLIPAVDIRPGMILTPSSVSRFAGSEIQGLPKYSTGDMRSKLTVSEADAICLWGKMHPEESSLSVIRKIPFVVYIAIGTLILWGLEVAFL